MKNPRLETTNYEFTIGRTETHQGWLIVLSLARHPKTHQIKEIVICSAGRHGSHLRQALHDLGVGLSRILDHRDPENGNPLKESELSPPRGFHRITPDELAAEVAAE